MAASEESIKRFMMAQDRAKKLIQMDVNGGLKQYEHKARQNAEMCLNEESTPQYQAQAPQQMSYAQEPLNVKTNSKLPKEILESFKTKQIDPSPLGYGVSSSILDEVNYRTQGKLYNEETKPQVQQPKKQIIETTQSTNNSNVDYSMIKMIVEDCMKKYTSALKKSLINESKANDSNATLQALKIGNKFSFIDNSGNVYEATLKKVGNLNKNK